VRVGFDAAPFFWIKFVLDLQPKNSSIKWCVDQGHTVFVISCGL
jgi:poly(3-hydroxyalkanoate) synthetase